MNHPDAHQDQSPWPVAEVDIHNAHDATEYADLEGCFRRLPGVMGVHLDRTRGVAHLSYDPGQTTAERVEEALSRCGYRCDCHPREGSMSQAGHPKVGEEHAAMDHAAMDHAAMGHAMPPAEHAGHAAMAHDEHAGHGAAMVGDMFRRFLVSLVLSAPLLGFSHIGAHRSDSQIRGLALQPSKPATRRGAHPRG